MSIECGYCERDLRGEHDADCPYNPVNRKPVEAVKKHAEAQSSAKGATLTDVLADKAKVYAWCESLDKGVIVCRKTGHLGDSETIAEVVKWMRDMSANV